MRQIMSPFIICLIINELCSDEGQDTKNTGTTGQECLEALMSRTAVTKDDFAFDSVADFKDLSKWTEAIANKDIVPLFDAYVVTPANVDPTFYEAGNFRYQTANAVKRTTYETYLSFCSHAALTSYSNSEYTRVFEFNSDGSIVGVTPDGEKVRGQKLKELNVGMRQIATAEKPAFAVTTMTYEDYKELEKNAVVVKPTWSHTDIEGIFDVRLSQVSASSTVIKAKVFADCGNKLITSLTAADFLVKNTTGVTQTVTFTAADSDGVYTFTGTAFASNFTVEIDGVVTSGEVSYEGVEPLKITVT